MSNEQTELKKYAESLFDKAHCEVVSLYPGIELCYLSLEEYSVPINRAPFDHVMQINYCRSGKMELKMKNGNNIHLGTGDFSVHPMGDCMDAIVSFPSGRYDGLAIFIDMDEAGANPPEVLKGTGIFRNFLKKKPDGDPASFFEGNERTEDIFSAFYDQPEPLRLAYQKVKLAELLLYLSSPEDHNQLAAYRTDHVEIIRDIHDQLTRSIGDRVTIEELAKQYLINPTTLKSAFKAVYGNSIAAHMREHRMEEAAKLLRETDLSVADIADRVGYDSQSKFTSAFKAYYHTLPREYRKKV